VASADRTYVDPSALRSLYVRDDRSVHFCAWRQRLGGTLAVTRFGRAELVNSVALGVHRKLLSASDARGALDDFEDDSHAGRISVIDVLWRRTLDLAAQLSERHTARLGTRSLDVLHVATALTLGMKQFVSYDGRQSALAKAAGMKVVAP
jgi:predicted nucleic acid-binding protein